MQSLPLVLITIDVRVLAPNQMYTMLVGHRLCASSLSLQRSRHRFLHHRQWTAALCNGRMEHCLSCATAVRDSGAGFLCFFFPYSFWFIAFLSFLCFSIGFLRFFCIPFFSFFFLFWFSQVFFIYMFLNRFSSTFFAFFLFLFLFSLVFTGFLCFFMFLYGFLCFFLFILFFFLFNKCLFLSYI